MSADFITQISDFLQNAGVSFSVLDKGQIKQIRVEVGAGILLSEDVWHSHRPIVESRIKAQLGISQRIPARLAVVRRIDKKTTDNFLINNHLQGTTSAKLKYGLFLPERYFRILKSSSLLEICNDNELLVAVASFSGAKKIMRNGIEHRSYELIRFANLLNCTVVGGLNKLLKKFTDEHQPDDIMTYADRDWSNGQSYEKLGFERIGKTPPQEFWVDTITYKRTPIGKQKMQTENAIKIYNSGSYKYLNVLKQSDDIT